MKRNRIGLFIGLFFIVAFIVTIVVSAIIIKKVIAEEQYKQAYYTSEYGLNNKENASNTPVKFPAQSYAMEEGTPQYTAIQKIKELHALADFLLLGSKFDNYTAGSQEGWGEILESEILLIENYETIANAMSEEPDIVKDMSNLKELVLIATSQYDPDALRYIHRILHDLDLYGYPETGKTASGYFGATYAVESANPIQIETINAFIAAKKVAVEEE